MPYPARAANIEAALVALATANPTICTRFAFPHPTHEGRTASYVRIAKASSTTRPAVLITGGIHAREWAPPDALLKFAQALVRAYSTNSPISYPGFTDPTPVPPITYPPFTVPLPDVKTIVEKLDLYIAPLINSDGREFSQSAPANVDWRKNRRPPSPPSTCFGVDINRNFDIDWDFDVYYNTAAAAKNGATKDPCDIETYIGPAAASEPETQNVQELMRDKNISLFIDVHSFGRKILYPWGTETDQSADSIQTFLNHDWDRGGIHGGRDGVDPGATAYEEYFPNAAPRKLFDKHILVARSMSNAVKETAGADPRAITRSTYVVDQSIEIGYTATGASDDYNFSRQFRVAGSPPTHSITIECGTDIDGEGGFHPDAAIYPKIEREIHAALRGALTQAAKWSDWCFIATAIFESPVHPQVCFLRDLRDRELKSTALGRSFMKPVERVYYSFSPQIAQYLGNHWRTRIYTRVLVVTPVVQLLRGCERITRPIQSRERRVASLVTLIAAIGLVALTVAVGIVYFILRGVLGL